jgi:hypothetical protein
LVYDGDARELSLTHHRIDGTIGDRFTIQESALTVESDDSSALGLIGIDSLFAIVALLGAALRKR